MTALKVLAVLALLLFLFTLIRVGAEVTYGESGLLVRVRFGKIWLTLFPRKPKKPKKKKEKPKKEEPEQPKEEQPEQPRRRGGLPIPLMELISIGLNAAGRTLERLQIDNLEVEYLIGGKHDPAKAAVLYGGVYATGGAIVPPLENAFYCIKHRDINAWIDFDSDQSLIWAQMALSICVGQLISIGFVAAKQFLTAYLRQRKENKQSQEGN